VLRRGYATGSTASAAASLARAAGVPVPHNASIDAVKRAVAARTAHLVQQLPTISSTHYPPYPPGPRLEIADVPADAGDGAIGGWFDVPGDHFRRPGLAVYPAVVIKHVALHKGVPSRECYMPDDNKIWYLPQAGIASWCTDEELIRGGRERCWQAGLRPEAPTRELPLPMEVEEQPPLPETGATPPPRQQQLPPPPHALPPLPPVESGAARISVMGLDPCAPGKAGAEAAFAAFCVDPTVGLRINVPPPWVVAQRVTSTNPLRGQPRTVLILDVPLPYSWIIFQSKVYLRGTPVSIHPDMSVEERRAEQAARELRKRPLPQGAGLPEAHRLRQARPEAQVTQLEAALAGRQADLVVSDMAPNLSGISSADAARIEYLVELAIEFAQNHMKPEGALVAKVFHGGSYNDVVQRFKAAFHTVKPYKPKASRDRSSETFLVGIGLR